MAAVYVNARGLAAALLCMSVSVQPAAAFDVIMVPTGNNPVPVSQNPADPEDSPEEIAKDAARDLKDTRFYNKPGATRAEYDAAWQECRLIARGSRTPGGTIPYYYNPAVVSPIAAGVGAGLGGLIAGAIAEGEQRRANRRQCLLIRGWRQVTVSPSQAERVKLMTDEERDTYFNSIVGAEAVDGEVLSRTGFTQYTSPEFPIDAPFSGDGAVFVDKKVDPAAPIAIAENEGLLAFGFRRTADGSAGRSVGVNLMRYDIEGRDLVYRPKDWKKKNDRTTYSIAATHGDKKAVYEVRLIKVTAGDYVLHNMAAGTLVPLTSNCFGAPTLRVGAGEIVYAGDFVPVINGRTPAGRRVDGVFWTSKPDDAQRALATRQGELAARMKPAEWRNVATYACVGTIMDRYDLPGFAELAPPAAAAPDSVSPPAPTTAPAEAQPAGS